MMLYVHASVKRFEESPKGIVMVGIKFKSRGKCLKQSREHCCIRWFSAKDGRNTAGKLL
jgi:hypothetical protein